MVASPHPSGGKSSWSACFLGPQMGGPKRSNFYTYHKTLLGVTMSHLHVALWPILSVTVYVNFTYNDELVSSRRVI